MGLLDKLKSGSTLTAFDGQTPKSSTGIVPLNSTSLQGSQLDLDGKTPKKYLDNLPE